MRLNFEPSLARCMMLSSEYEEVFGQPQAAMGLAYIIDKHVNHGTQQRSGTCVPVRVASRAVPERYAQVYMKLLSHQTCRPPVATCLATCGMYIHIVHRYVGGDIANRKGKAQRNASHFPRRRAALCRRCAPEASLVEVVRVRRPP